MGKVRFGSWLLLPLLLPQPPWRHTLLGISGVEASRVLGAERIMLPHQPVSRFHKVFKAPFAFSLQGQEECTGIGSLNPQFNSFFKTNSMHFVSMLSTIPIRGGGWSSMQMHAFHSILCLNPRGYCVSPRDVTQTCFLNEHLAADLPNVAQSSVKTNTS